MQMMRRYRKEGNVETEGRLERCSLRAQAAPGGAGNAAAPGTSGKSVVLPIQRFQAPSLQTVGENISVVSSSQVCDALL